MTNPNEPEKVSYSTLATGDKFLYVGNVLTKVSKGRAQTEDGYKFTMRNAWMVVRLPKE